MVECKQLWKNRQSRWEVCMCGVSESGPWEWGSSYRGEKWEMHLRIYRGGRKYTEGAGARDSSLLPWNPVRKFENSHFQVFTAVPVTYKFQILIGVPRTYNFHGSPQIFWQGFKEVNGNPARRHLCIFSPTSVYIRRYISRFAPLYDEPHSHGPESVNSTVNKYSDYWIWDDMSKRMTRDWNDTSWQEASEFLCIKTPTFGREFSTKKDHQKTLEKLSPMRC